MSRALIRPQLEEVLAPRDGVVPYCVGTWKARLQLQWFATYLRELLDQYEEIPEVLRFDLHLDTYWVTSGYHRGMCCGACVRDTATCPVMAPGVELFGCCHKSHSFLGC